MTTKQLTIVRALLLTFPVVFGFDIMWFIIFGNPFLGQPYTPDRIFGGFMMSIVLVTVYSTTFV